MFTITEGFGEPETGKTHNLHEGWPDPLHIDTAVTKLSVADHEVKVQDAEHGESWGVVSKIYDWDEDEAGKHYRYVTDFEAVRQAVIDDAGEHQTIILDNTYDLRSMAVKKYLSMLKDDRTWIRREEYGAVNEMVDEISGWIVNRGYHLVWISQMDDEYQNDVATGEREPKSPKMANHRTNFRLEFTIEDGERCIYVRKNRHMDPTSDEMGARGSNLGQNVSLDELFIYSDVPESEWEL